MRRKRTEAVAHLLVRRAAEADPARLGECFASIVTIEPPDYSLARLYGFARGMDCADLARRNYGNLSVSTLVSD